MRVRDDWEERGEAVSLVTGDVSIAPVETAAIIPVKVTRAEIVVDRD